MTAVIPVRRLLNVAQLMATGIVLGLGCNSASDATNSPPSAPPSADARTTGVQGWPRVEGMHGQRYCEVLLARAVEGRLNAEVWNSFGFSDCPADAWAALDPVAIKAERGVLAALLNGPRYFLMDAIEKQPSGERPTTRFGTLEMFLGATVDLGPIPPNLAPYTERHVARGTVFEYAAGREVYELQSPEGETYIMQSYSQQTAPLTPTDLPGLASRLTLPAGWSYRVRTLDRTLRVTFPDVQATVVQDDLSNTYSLVRAD